MTLEKKAIPVDYHGLRIDKALAMLFPEYSRGHLTQLLKAQQISVNGLFLQPKDKIRGGEIVEFKENMLPPSVLTLTPEEIPLNIVYEDDDCLVVNKPAGLIVHPGAGNPTGTLVQGLLHHDSNLHHLPRAGIIHRLDKETTGLLIVAKNQEAYTALTRQMQAREIDRHYLALVFGKIISGGRIQTGYGRDPKNRLKMTVGEYERQAITTYTVKERFEKTTLLDIKLETGRTHQIRVHMAHIHHPIIGDTLYGGRIRTLSAALNFRRQALHAYQLSFAHPKHAEKISLSCPLPDDFLNLLQGLAHESFY
jgi:23S rRNA pseudouridine1911/1915/1917 synthase